MSLPITLTRQPRRARGISLSLNKPQLVISHDRFSGQNCNLYLGAYDLRAEKLPGNYTAYRQQKAIELKEQNREYEKQQRRIAELKEEIHRRSSWYNGAHKAAGQNDFYRSKAKNMLKEAKRKRNWPDLRPTRSESPKEVSQPLKSSTNNFSTCVCPSFDQSQKPFQKLRRPKCFQNLSFDLCRGDKVALIGPNGSGKTTF